MNPDTIKTNKIIMYKITCVYNIIGVKWKLSKRVNNNLKINPKPTISRVLFQLRSNICL